MSGGEAMKLLNLRVNAGGFPGGLVVRNLPSSAGDTGLISGQDLKFHMSGGN